MTNEEAIKLLRHSKPTTDTRRWGIELCEACDVAIKALAKQIPMPLISKDNWICPECGQMLTEDQPHCDYCGQAIDWSISNDD